MQKPAEDIMDITDIRISVFGSPSLEFKGKFRAKDRYFRIVDSIKIARRFNVTGLDEFPK